MTVFVIFAQIANLSQFANFVDGKVHTEGGSFPRTQQQYGHPREYEQEADIVELVNSNRYPTTTNNFIDDEDAQDEEYDQKRRQAAGIVSELAQLRNAGNSAADEDSNQYQPAEQILPELSSYVSKPRGGREDTDVAGQSTLEELRRFSEEIKELASREQQQEGNGGIPEYEPEIIEVEREEDEEVAGPKVTKARKVEKPLTAQKKGQSEFVEFVEPAHHALPASAKKLKNLEYMEKRVADSMRMHRQEQRLGLISSSGNVVFIAFVTMCCVLSVVGIVGGAYYYKHVRSIREDPFDDFTRYSPAGPGRDKQLKKGKGSSGGMNFTSEKGDDSLAYRAQLHHYQQTKQKIIGGGDDGGIIGGGNGGNANGNVMNLDDDASDKSDDEGDLEHNFSVYECPGLAPTGDIEVQNPNFVEAGRPPPPYQPHKDRSSPTN